MENLTHALTGWTLARAGLGRQIPAGGAMMILAANIPDIDVIAAIRGPAAYLEQHRGITHSLAASPAMAALCVLPFALRKRRGFPWLRAFLGAWVAVLSHLAWDWTNIYGIRLFEPFSSAWFRADWTPVLDPAVWLILIAGAFWPFLSRLVSQEIGAPAGNGPERPSPCLSCSAPTWAPVQRSTPAPSKPSNPASTTKGRLRGRPRSRIC